MCAFIVELHIFSPRFISVYEYQGILFDDTCVEAQTEIAQFILNNMRYMILNVFLNFPYAQKS